MLTVLRISSALATVIIETFFYGIYIVLFVISLYLLFTVQSKGLRRDRPVWLSPILLGGSVLFIALTGHWILTIDRLFLAFVIVDDGRDPVAFYKDFSQATQIVQTGFLLGSLAIVDVLFVHRLATVWAYDPRFRYVMIFPTLTLLGLVVSAVGVLYDFSQFKPGDDVLLLANGWIPADCAFTICTNVYCTALIAWKLWKVQNVLKTTGGRTLMSVLAIIVESAALSATWAIFFIITYVSWSNLRFLIDVTPAIVGTANMLIYVHVCLGWAHAPESTTASTAIQCLKIQYCR
ncbi:hypothetical protein MVEN_01069100 [Mycena venus]|uniref:Uncharacterized protein n=1 Tax=Mycena venus TaxID=2733690 RepID=A0A8H6Y451_9AGAR|nr:hypothetical protein MVEN_01069100 [Mycena venus]